MTALLYYFIYSNLNKNKITKIDKKVTKNQQEVYSFLRNLLLNSKCKVKKLSLYVLFIFLIKQPLAPCSVSIFLFPVINRLSFIEEN